MKSDTRKLDEPMYAFSISSVASLIKSAASFGQTPIRSAALYGGQFFIQAVTIRPLRM